MPTFNLIRDEKVQVWLRYRVVVEAETEEEAVVKLSCPDDPNGWDCQDGVDTAAAEVLFDTQVLLQPVAGSPYGTIEIVSDEPNKYQRDLWSNAVPAGMEPVLSLQG